MRRILSAGLLLVALLVLPALPGCTRRAADRGPQKQAGETAVPGEAATGTTAPVETGAALSAIEVERVLGVKTDFAEAGPETVEARVEAVGVVQLAVGAKAKQAGVFALIAAMNEAAPGTGVRVEIWTPGEPDARFAQYVWTPEAARLERFEASVPSLEFAALAPAGGSDAAASPKGFDAGRTGVMEGVDPAKLRALASGESPSWVSETP